MENRALRICQKVIAVNRKIKEKLLTTYKFLNFDDVFIIPHGYGQQDFEGLQPIPKTNDKMKITYSGIFYENITPKYLLRAFKVLTKERPDIAQNIELHFVGHFRKENQKLVKKLNLQEYVFEHGYLEHIISTDILWIMLGNSKKMESVSAGKLFEYFGSGKPIMASLPEGASRAAVEEYGASFITSPDNENEIKEMLIKVHELYKKKALPVPDETFVLKHSLQSNSNFI